MLIITGSVEMFIYGYMFCILETYLYIRFNMYKRNRSNYSKYNMVNIKPNNKTGKLVLSLSQK